VTTTLNRARWGVTLLFLTNGMVWATLVPRYPEIRDSIGLTYAQLGLAVACGPAGAIVLGLTASALIRRFTSRWVAVASTVLMAGAALSVAFAHSWLQLALSLFALGALDSITDVAQNAHGLRVQKAAGRSMLNTFHATWSIGSVAGGLLAGAAAGLGLSVPLHVTISGVLVVAILAAAVPLLLTGPDSTEDEDASATTLRGVPVRSWLILLALGFIAIAGVWVEDAGGTWATSYLRDVLEAGPTLASMGFVGLMLLHFVGRVTGDRLIDLWGQRAVARVGAVITTVGMGVALAFPSTWLTIVGFALAGLGVATTVPAAMHGADTLPGFRAGTGLTIASWMLRIGFLVSPPIVGAVADATSLRVGLLVVPFAGVVILALSGVLSTARAAQVEATTDRA